jgi:predicted permease
MTIDAGGRRIATPEAVHCNSVSPGFFQTLGVQLTAGRDFDDHDANDEPGFSEPFRSAIVNESFVRRYLPERDPLGARVGFGTFTDARTDIQVVGVVKTFHYRGLREMEDQVFFPVFEGMLVGGSFYVRTRVDSPAAFASIRSAVRRVDPGLPVLDLRTIDDQLDRVLVTERMLATLASAFACLATLLAVVGLYGVLSFVVARRTREIGIRIALGASRMGAVGLVLRDAGLLISGGLALALPVVWGLTRLVESQLFGVRPMDAATIAGAAALVVLVALLASALPARRASAVDPIVTLRAE